MGNQNTRKTPRSKPKPLPIGKVAGDLDGSKDVEVLTKESSAQLNAIRLRDIDFRLIRACGFDIEKIEKPLIIIISYQKQSIRSCIVEEYKDREDILVCQQTTHRQTKDWTTKAIKKLKQSDLLQNYDGVIFVPLCVVKAQVQDNEDRENGKTFKYYYDATDGPKHVDKLRKDVVYRLDDNHRFYVHWRMAIHCTILGDGQRLNPANYNTNTIDNIQQLLEEQILRDDRLIIHGYCRQELLQHHDVLRVIVDYYQIIMDHIYDHE